MNQTYKNLEIILVDDGSPDRCGEICEEYASKDGRVMVIHRKNGGLSAARNTGLDVATGNYIGFVDSDDYIAPEMYEYLLSTILEEAADIVSCGYYEVRKNGIVERSCYDDMSLTLQEIREKMWGVMSAPAVWRRLYKRFLFDELRFPEGRLFEDFILMPRLYNKAEKIIAIEDCLYFYNCARDDSIMNQLEKDISYEYNHFYTHMERLKEEGFDRNRYYAGLMRQMVNNGFILLRKHSQCGLLKKGQLDFIVEFLEENMTGSSKKRELFLYRHCKWIYKMYSRYRLEKKQREKQCQQ